MIECVGWGGHCGRYGHRALMGAVYTSTELFLLTDGSPQFADTWRFLERSTKVRWGSLDCPHVFYILTLLEKESPRHSPPALAHGLGLGLGFGLGLGQGLGTYQLLFGSGQQRIALTLALTLTLTRTRQWVRPLGALFRRGAAEGSCF